MWSLLLWAVVLIEGNNGAISSRCKRDINSVFPHGFCGTFHDCYSCNEAGCGWCGGAGCGKTKQGCYNKSERVLELQHRVQHNNERHDDEHQPLCGAKEGDEWLDDASKCTFCEQYQTCGLCLTAPIPTWDRKDARCVWCEESRSCRRGSALGGPFYRKDTCEHWRWQQGHGQCDTYVECAQQSSCFFCANSFAALNARCHWCSDPSVPWINDEEGGGRCFDPRTHNGTCPKSIDVTSAMSCPTRRKTTDSPSSSQQPLTRVDTLIMVGAVAILLTLLIFVAYKLSM